jgi:protease II
VNASLTAGGNVYGDFRFSADGTKIGYVADQDTDETLELYVVPTDSPGTATKMSASMNGFGDVCRFKFSPDSQRVAYCADQDTDELVELYSVALNQPGQSIKLNSTLAAGGKVHTDYQFSADSSFIVYRAEQEQAGRTELYRVSIANPGVTAKLNPALVAGGNVETFRIADDDARVAYLAEQDTADVWEIYEVALAQPGTATKVSAPMSSEGAYYFEYAENSSRIVYTAAQQSASVELYDVALTHPAQSTELNGSMVAGGEVYDFIVTP